jgi:hypothetical protein
MAFNLTQVPLHAFPISPSDTVNQNGVGFYVGGSAGDVTVRTVGSPAYPPALVTFPAVPLGATVAIQFTQLRASGTAATGIVAFAGA